MDSKDIKKQLTELNLRVEQLVDLKLLELTETNPKILPSIEEWEHKAGRHYEDAEDLKEQLRYDLLLNTEALNKLLNDD